MLKINDQSIEFENLEKVTTDKTLKKSRGKEIINKKQKLMR